MDRRMDLDDVVSIFRGLGYLIAQDRANWFPEDMDVIREGIGLLVLDLGRRLVDIALEQDHRAMFAAVRTAPKITRKRVRS